MSDDRKTNAIRGLIVSSCAIVLATIVYSVTMYLIKGYDSLAEMVLGTVAFAMFGGLTGVAGCFLVGLPVYLLLDKYKLASAPVLMAIGAVASLSIVSLMWGFSTVFDDRADTLMVGSFGAFAALSYWVGAKRPWTNNHG